MILNHHTAEIPTWMDTIDKILRFIVRIMLIMIVCAWFIVMFSHFVSSVRFIKDILATGNRSILHMKDTERDLKYGLDIVTKVILWIIFTFYAFLNY